MAHVSLMMKMAMVVGLFALAGALGGCSSHISQLEAVQPTGGSAFTQSLTDEYRTFVVHEKEEGDWSDADYFAKKGLAAANGEVVLPEEVGGVPEASTGDLTDGRARLMTALDGGARDSNAAGAARAQVAFDCWLHETQENLGEEHLASCRDEFKAAMAELEGVKEPTAPGSYVILFDWDKSNINDAGQAVIDQILADIRSRGGNVGVSATGYTDRSGSEEYNLALSLQRADAVREALIAGGVSAESITTAGRGESENAVPTADGVREQANRRVEVTLQ
jgi:OOP family OmpA-OmpF porin